MCLANKLIYNSILKPRGLPRGRSKALYLHATKKEWKSACCSKIFNAGSLQYFCEL